MLKRIVTGLLVFLSISTLTATSELVANASGTITIKADGTVDPPTAPIRRNGDVYVLTGYVYEPIVVERNNTVIDGDGYVVQGSGGGTGILLFRTNNVTVTNFEIKTFYWGIYLEHASNNTICGNKITNIHYDCIGIDSCSNITISGNEMAIGSEGIKLSYSSECSITKNKVVTCKNSGVWVHHSSGIVSENSIVESSSGYRGGVYVDYSSGTRIYGNDVSKGTHGIRLHYSSHCEISENNVELNRYNVRIERSSDNVFSHNSFFEAEYAHVFFSEAGYVNLWDDGYRGNYWSDHNPPDKNCDKIGDINYTIDKYNVDHFPLIYPYEFYQPGYVRKTDVNKDEIVNILDLAQVGKAFGCEPGDSRWDPLVDMDLNKIINILDISMIGQDFGKTT